MKISNEMNDKIRAIRIKVWHSKDEKYLIKVAMTVKLTTGRHLRLLRWMHDTQLEQMFVTEVNLMFDELRRQFYKPKGFTSTSPVNSEDMLHERVSRVKKKYPKHDIWNGALYDKRKKKVKV